MVEGKTSEDHATHIRTRRNTLCSCVCLLCLCGLLLLGVGGDGAAKAGCPAGLGGGRGRVGGRRGMRGDVRQEGGADQRAEEDSLLRIHTLPQEHP